MPGKDDLTPTESAILVVLLAEAREISNKELETRFGFTLTGKSKDKLNALGLIKSRRLGRVFVHELDSGGWDRFQEPLNFDGARPRAFGAALATLLAAVRRYVDRKHDSLAIAFAPEIAAPPARPSAAPDLTDRIRATYAAVASTPRAWVSIRDIRRELDDVPRPELDGALRRLEQAADVNIVPESNQKTLSEDERAAAVLIGDQPKHLLAIGV
ncbi:MAG TPA: hypothetical protein VFR11_01290 [Micromonosporaceae bacterium]|jgi:hypothetical protein|nr:hypothetical protein [Micromonosporaceae bacterium]